MTTTSCRPVYVFFRCRNMGSTLSAPWAYLQKHGWPWMGIPASLEIFLSCSVKDLEEGARQARHPVCWSPDPTQPNPCPGVAVGAATLDRAGPRVHAWKRVQC